MAAQSPNDRWTVISRIAGLVIVGVVIVLRASGLMEWTDAQFLLGIAACLLGIFKMLRGGGEK